MSDKVHCQFKHVPSKSDGERLVKNIDTFVGAKSYDRAGIRKCGENGNDTILFVLSRQEANKVRDQLPDVLPTQDSPIWFNIISDPLNLLIPQTLATTEEDISRGSVFSATCQFGSLRSYNLFYSHISFDNKLVNLRFEPARTPNSLCIEFDDIRIKIPFVSIQKKNILVNKVKSENGVFVLLPLKCAPYVYELAPNNDNKKANQNSNMKQIRLCGGENNVDIVNNIGLCSDVVFHFPPSRDQTWLFLLYFFLERPDRPDRYNINFSTFKILNWPMNENNKNRRRPDPFNYRRASFHDRYCLHMLTSLGYVFRDKWAELTDDELNWNKWDEDERYPLCCFAVEQLCLDHGYDLTRTERDYKEKRRNQSNRSSNEQEVSIDAKNKLKIPVCSLTPLKYIFRPFEITTGSRAIRNPKLGDSTRFLLVHFREEDNKTLRTSQMNVKNRLRNSMLNGIELFGNRYRYIGASTGQMKEMSFWFYDLPSNMKDIKEAHQCLGDFDKINNIATYIARVGQYFSTTWPIGIKLTEIQDKSDIPPNGKGYYVMRIPDIKPDEYNFTDGIRKISWGLAGRVAQRMNFTLTRKEDIPSAYQIRMAGCKGMVAIDPESNLDEYYIQVRDSMVKFESSDWNLEICEYARPLTLTLNNQVIRLLSDLGNPDSAFVTLQKRGFKQWSVPEEQQPTAIDIAVAKNASYSLSKENLISNRIPIPPEDGRNLFGIADESGKLEYGQCFIQYSTFNQTRNGEREYHVVTGSVIVTKNPCLWPGDIRKLTAVRNNKLEECFRDVIVFPTTGERPHSNEIAGSDLDGDQYWVYWGENFKIEKNVLALSYEGAKKKNTPSIKGEAIIDHIVNSFESNMMMGIIANTHTVAAEKNKQHSFADDCKRLAELFSLAVDAPKTGRFISKDEIRPFQIKYCNAWPKYMKKFSQPVSESSSILNILFTNAEEKYFQLRENPINTTTAQTRKSTTQTQRNKVVDENFQNWLNGNRYEKSSTTPKPSKSTTRKNKYDDDPQDDGTDEDNDDSTLPINKKLSRQKKDGKDKKEKDPIESSQKPSKPPNEKKTTNSQPSEELKKTTNAQDQSSLFNSFSANSGASSLIECSSLSPSKTESDTIDFLMIVGFRIIATSNLKSDRNNEGSLTIFPEKNEKPPTREEVINKLTTHLTKHDVFKKLSRNDEDNPDSLYLITSYGYICFDKDYTLPKKYGEFLDSIKKNDDKFIDFRYADVRNLTLPRSSSSTTRKPTFYYEFNCQLPELSPKYIKLLFDKNKNLQEICVCRTRERCYARQPNFQFDNLYEIHSIREYDSSSLEYKKINDLIFQRNSKDFLTEIKSNIKIDRKCLKSSVVPLNLKINDEEYPINIDQGTVEGFYRTVHYISLREGADRSTVTSTVECHFKSITKDESTLEKIFRYAFSPVQEK